MSIGLLDFDTSPAGFVEFSQNDPLQQIYPSTGVAGTNGVGLTLAPGGMIGDFGGVAIGDQRADFDLTVAGLTSGMITPDDVRNIEVSFDVNIPIGLTLPDFGFEPAQGGGSERIPFSGDLVGTGDFQTVTFRGRDAAPEIFDLSNPDSRVIAFLSVVNGGPATVKLAVNATNDLAGQTVFFDNVEFSVVPEPSSSLLALISLGFLAGRRRR